MICLTNFSDIKSLDRWGLGSNRARGWPRHFCFVSSNCKPNKLKSGCKRPLNILRKAEVRKRSQDRICAANHIMHLNFRAESSDQLILSMLIMVILVVPMFRCNLNP